MNMNEKRRGLATALLITVILGPPAALAIESHIDAVTVYPRGADVTRVAHISLAQGVNAVTLEGFPGNIDLGRTRAMVAYPGAELRFIRLDVREQRDAYDAEVRRLEAAITELEDSIEAINDDIAAARLQLKFLEGLAQDYADRERGEAASGQADPASWQQAMNSIGSGASGAMEKIRKAHKLRRKAERELSVLERELENKGGRRTDSAVLRISLASDKALDTTLRVSYFQPLARWESSYSAHLDSASSKLRLMHEARVFQATSEEWQNVQLTLSTGDPGGAMQAPGQESAFLDIEEQAERITYKIREESSNMAFGEGLGAPEEIVVAARATGPNRYGVVYRAGDRTDVISGTDDAQGAPLAEYRASVSLVTRTTPRKSALAYLTARYRHDSNTPLFGGPLRVFVDGAFAGLTALPELLPGAEAVLPMGPDPQVEVTTVDQGGEKGREGFLGARNTELTDYLFKIVNRHARTTTVEVVDFYPVSRDERIKVSVPDSATKPDEQYVEDRPGVVAWRRNLKPGENWRIAHQYEISHPKNVRLAN